MISLCMIVKNEEKTLEACLTSVSHYVNEIIIVDTGSTDQTKNIAKKFHATIVDYKWNNDFSAARNFANTQANHPWILQLDADEYMNGNELKLMIQHLDKVKEDGLVLPIHNLNDEGEVGIVHQNIRVFKKDPFITYEGRIHEHLKHIKRPFTYQFFPAIITHTGYQNHVVGEKNKQNRNLELLLEEVKEQPKDAYRLNNLATNYILRKEFNQSIDFARQAFECAPSDEQRSRALLLEVESYWMQNEYQIALDTLQKKESKITSMNKDLLFTKAKLLFLTGEYEKAKCCCIQRVQTKTHSNIVKHKDEEAYLLLIKIQVEQRDIVAAHHTFEQVMKYKKNDLKFAQEYARFIAKWMDYDDILHHFDYHYEDNVMKWALCLLIRHKKGIQKYQPSEKLELGLSDKIFIEGLKNNEKEIIATIKEDMDVHLHAMIIFALIKHPNDEIQKALHTPFLSVFQKGMSLITPFKKEEFFALLKLLVEIKDYENAQKLLDGFAHMELDDLLTITNLLMENFLDESALEYAKAYLKMDPNNKDMHKKVQHLKKIIK